MPDESERFLSKNNTQVEPQARRQWNFISRRSLLKIGASTVGLMATTSMGLAALCPSVSTPRQTRGPYFPYDDDVSFPIREHTGQHSLIEANDNDLTVIKGKPGKAQGQVVYFRGQLLVKRTEGKSQADVCHPLPGATVLLWQANFSGRYNHKLDDTVQPRFPHPKTGKMIERVHDEHFQYWGKVTTDQHGQFQFKTILPGFYPAADDWYRPPHLHFSIRAKGFQEFVTQTYFKGNDLPNFELIQDLNAKDFILRNPRIPADQQEQVIVEYRKDPDGMLNDGLVGTCQLLLPG